ncbi:MAG: hypothetical protein AB7I27_11580 [Bacteriovoracaceae bacterium]
MKLLGVFILLGSASSALAEYRAYQYLVKSRDPYAMTTNAAPQYITSNLNPQMYKSYHGGSFISVELLRTWICPGHTARKKICDHPYDKELPIQ